MTVKKKNTEIVETEKTIVDSVLAKVNQFQEAGELKLPKDYSPENALKSAYLILTESVMKDKTTPVLNGCTSVSIANTLLDMVVQGLSPLKKQCYFIPYGNQLQLSRSYLGSIAVARRVGLEDIIANVVFNDDIFNYQIDAQTGRFKILQHEQELENIDITKIRGAYAITDEGNGKSNVTVMTITQIKQSWLQGYAKGNSGAHTNFTDEMCKKTVINRACKLIINSSTDAMLDLPHADEEEDEAVKGEPLPKANIKEIEINAEEVVLLKKQEKEVVEKKLNPDF